MIQHECRCPGCGSCGAAQREEKLREEIVRLRFAIKALYDKPYVDSLRSLVDSKNGERIVAEHRAMVAERERDELKAEIERERRSGADLEWQISRIEEEIKRTGMTLQWTDGGGSKAPSGWARNPYLNYGDVAKERDLALQERDELKARLAHAEADAEQAIHNEAFMERQRIISYIRARLAHATMEDRFGRERGLLIDLANAIEAGEPAGETR
jgi:hypothetical protein